eukprot:SAG31_NODE_1369_length_8611_cov_3.505169_6_plen_412_part_00
MLRRHVTDPIGRTAQATQSVSSVVLKLFTDQDWEGGKAPPCEYPTAERGCDNNCNIQNISKSLTQHQCANFFMGVDFHDWTGCSSTLPADPTQPEQTAHCWGVFNSLVTRCGACHDPFLTSTMVRIVESAASDSKCLKECTSPQHLADTIRDLCCSGTDGFLGHFANIDDSCDTLKDGSVTWHFPRTCDKLSPCGAYVSALATACPITFADGVGLGLLAQCGGDVSSVVAKGADCDDGLTLPPNALIGSCPKHGRMTSGQTCELHCDDDYCLEGTEPGMEAVQPRCINGKLTMDVKCRKQQLVDCQTPRNGGCDPLTKCDDSTNIFGSRLVRCGPCPPGYFGSGRSKCTRCPLGSYWNASMLDPWVINDGERVYRGTRTEQCVPCPNGSSTRQPGSVNISSCICKPVGTNL